MVGRRKSIWKTLFLWLTLRDSSHDLEETVTLGDSRFLRPKGRRNAGEERRLQGILKRTLQGAFSLLVLSLVVFGSHRIYHTLLADSLFRLKEVEVIGSQRIARETLLSLARVEGSPNLFTVKVKEVAKRLQTHPWIEGVVVRKTFPNKITIHVEERKPLAILQLDEPYYIDLKGVIFSPVGDRGRYNYPFLTGLDREALEKDSEGVKERLMSALELLVMAEKGKIPPLEEISEIHLGKTSGIQCFAKDEGLEVMMGWDQFGEKLRRLSLIWSDLRRKGLAVRYIDCSDLDRMVVRRASTKENSVRR